MSTTPSELNGDGSSATGDLPAGIVCVQNAYSLVSRDDEDIWFVGL